MTSLLLWVKTPLCKICRREFYVGLLHNNVVLNFNKLVLKFRNFKRPGTEFSVYG